MAVPLPTTGSLSPTFVPARTVALAVRLPYAFTLYGWFPSILKQPLSASDTLSEATAQSNSPPDIVPRPDSGAQVRNLTMEGWYPNSDSMQTDVHTSQSPTYPVHPLPDPSIKLE